MNLFPREGNIPIPVEGVKTGQPRPVRLNPNLNGYRGGKLTDLPMYHKMTDKDPGVSLVKKTIVQMLNRDS